MRARLIISSLLKVLCTMVAWARIRASVKPPELNRYMTPCLAVTVFSQSNLELIARLAINVGLAKLNVTRGDRLVVIARTMESSANIKIFLLKSKFPTKPQACGT